MNSDQLRNFELTYRERNYSAAARKVPVSHQGLVKSIRALEKELDVPLFLPDPSNGMPLPTPYADELFEFVNVFNSNFFMLEDSFRKLKGKENRTIRVGLSLGVYGAFGHRFAQELPKLYPGIDVSFFEANDFQVEKDLRTGECDLAIVVSPITSGFEGKSLYQSPMYFWARVDTELGKRATEGGNATVMDLEGLDIAIPGNGFKCLQHLKKKAEVEQVNLGEIVEISEIFQIFDFVSRGIGVGFSNGTLIDIPCFNYDPSLVAVPMSDLTWGFSIIRKHDHVLTSNERLFWEWCAMTAKTLGHNSLAQA